MKTKTFHSTSGSRYGSRVGELETEKKKVAQAVVHKILWRDGHQPANPLFIGDGSSASYVFCYFMQEWVKRGDENLRIWTNNLDVPMQVLCEGGAREKVSIHTAPGEFSYENCAIVGKETEHWVEEHCGRSTCILAVTALDADLGPCGKGEDAKAIKTAMVKSANVLVIVADHLKLGKPRNPQHAAAPEEWRKWRDERSKDGRLFVITTRSPNIPIPYPPHPIPEHSLSDNRSQFQIECENLRRLNLALREQLIIA